MPNYHRVFQPGGTFFFTVVTASRSQWLCSENARALLRTVLLECKERWPFDIDAIVLLPDHLHAIWRLPDSDSDYSRRWAWIKRTFSAHWLRDGGPEQLLTESKQRQRRRGVWQPRFWEHTIRDQKDYSAHLDYIHYNPVKHGLALCPHGWPHSSFHRWVQRDGYALDWQCCCGERKPMCPDFTALPTSDME
jgi:putative transposase